MEPPPKTKETKPIQQRRLFFFWKEDHPRFLIDSKSDPPSPFITIPIHLAAVAVVGVTIVRIAVVRVRVRVRVRVVVSWFVEEVRLGSDGRREEQQSQDENGDQLAIHLFVFFCPALMKLNKSIDDNGRHEGSHLGLEVKLEVK